MIKIKGARLLSTKEFEMLPRGARNYHGDWWLSTGGTIPLRAMVVCQGSLHIPGRGVSDRQVLVRPVLVIEADEKIPLGQELLLGGKRFLCISENLAFCMEDIGCCPFRSTWTNFGAANSYECSDIKNYIEKWLKNCCAHKIQPRKLTCLHVQRNWQNVNKAQTLKNNHISNDNAY